MIDQKEEEEDEDIQKGSLRAIRVTEKLKGKKLLAEKENVHPGGRVAEEVQNRITDCQSLEEEWEIDEGYVTLAETGHRNILCNFHEFSMCIVA